MNLNAHYFREFLPALFGRSLVPGNEALNAAFRVVVDDEPGRQWCLVVRDGKLLSSEEIDCDTDVTFELRAEVFEQLIRGKLSPVDAFLSQQIAIKGDLEQGLVLGAVLEAFFQQYPYVH
jgi:predicted lipid carrier protein YhbT